MKPSILFFHLIALAVAVLVYGAIPFYSIPTLGQVVWISGFAHSFCNSEWPTLFASNFGFPQPSPIAFGLPGAILESILLHLYPLNAADAYAIGAIMWIGISLAGCILLARTIGAGPVTACFGSLIYLTLPFIWVHSIYSMLSFAFALLPLYIFSAFKLINSSGQGSIPRICINGILFLFICFLSIFMDGYTYVMFFCATGIIYSVAFIRKEQPRFRLAAIAGPIILFGAAASYITYIVYEQGANFAHESIDFFRGWGADILMLLTPSQGVSWFLDFLHLSIARDPLQNFGDASVWMTTFCAPLIITGACGFWLAKRHRFALPLLLISLMGFYLCLGPSLKINSHRPPAGTALTKDWPLMAEELAPIPTGSAFLDRGIPGFKSMRSSYRWSALLFVGLFGLTILLVNKLQIKPETKYVPVGIVGLLIAINIPDVPGRLADARHYRKSMLQLTDDLKPLNEAIGEGRRVAFYPQGNDFLVNYIAALGRYRAFNVGGDKNVELASANYPTSVVTFFNAPFTDSFDQQIDRFLENCDADCIVIPYFNLLWNAHEWPPDEEAFLRLTASGATLTRVPDTRDKFAPAITKLANNAKYHVVSNRLYSVISLTAPCNPALYRSIDIGTEVSFSPDSNGLTYLRSGWSQPESQGVWTQGKKATIFLSPQGAADRNLTLNLVGLGLVTRKHPVQSVGVCVNGQPIKALKITTAEPSSHLIDIPPALVKTGDGSITIELELNDAISPSALGLSSDNRQLGFCLVSLSLR
jgi:hypothetical protein